MIGGLGNLETQDFQNMSRNRQKRSAFGSHQLQSKLSYDTITDLSVPQMSQQLTHALD